MMEVTSTGRHRLQRGLDRGWPPVSLLNAAAVCATLASIAHLEDAGKHSSSFSSRRPRFVHKARSTREAYQQTDRQLGDYILRRHGTGASCRFIAATWACSRSLLLPPCWAGPWRSAWTPGRPGQAWGCAGRWSQNSTAQHSGAPAGVSTLGTE